MVDASLLDGKPSKKAIEALATALCPGYAHNSRAVRRDIHKPCKRCRVWAKELTRVGVRAVSSVVTEEMVDRGMEVVKKWGGFQCVQEGTTPPHMIVDVGEHPRIFIEDVLQARGE